MSQQIVYEPGFSAGVTLSTVTVPPGATLPLIATLPPVVSGVPDPVVFVAENTCEPSAYPLPQVVVPVLVSVTAIRPLWSAIGAVSNVAATLYEALSVPLPLSRTKLATLTARPGPLADGDGDGDGDGDVGDAEGLGEGDAGAEGADNAP